MKISKTNGKDERRILIGMITDDYVCGSICAKWEKQLFVSKASNIVSTLCAQYYKEFDKAPNKDILSLFEVWSDGQQDKSTAEAVGSFLQSLSYEHEEKDEPTNNKYLVELASKHFTKIKLERTLKKIREELDRGNTARAVECHTEFSPVRLATGNGIAVLHDKEALLRAFAERADSLIELSGDLGKFFNQALQREGFISLLGPEKRGKTTWLTYLAWKAMLQRKRVAFFSVGDESEENMMLRFCVLASKTPLRPGVCKIPTSIKIVDKEVEIDYEEIDFPKGVSARISYQAFKKVVQKHLKSKRDFLKLSTHPSGSLSIAGIESQLKVWEMEGWIPDVIVVDYMDLLQESGSGRDDKRHRINATWQDMRGLLQRWHALGLTATQANAASNKVKTITRENFSEDKRKLAHVTGMAGLNQSDDEKRRGLMRLNWIVARNFDYYTPKTVKCAGCFGIANPAIRCVY